MFYKTLFPFLEEAVYAQGGDGTATIVVKYDKESVEKLANEFADYLNSVKNHDTGKVQVHVNDDGAKLSISVYTFPTSQECCKCF